MEPRIPVLLYHRIDEAGTASSIAPAAFRQHLGWLHEQGWSSLSLDEFTGVIHNGRRARPKSFLITFDDGYESVASAALEVLEEYDFSAVCFLATGFLRAPRHAPRSLGITPEPHLYMSWEQARALQSGGRIECQSHSHTHSKFSGFTTDALTQELIWSVDLLTSELQLPRSHFVHFAWPWGMSTPNWRAAAMKAGMRYQYGVAKQAFRPEIDTEMIPRTCFDAHTFQKFNRQFWLQTGQMSALWDLIYPHGQWVRRTLQI